MEKTYQTFSFISMELAGIHTSFVWQRFKIKPGCWKIIPDCSNIPWPDKHQLNMFSLLKQTPANANRINTLTQQNPTPVRSLLEFVLNASLQSYIYTSIQNDLQIRKKSFNALQMTRIVAIKDFFVTIEYFNYLKRNLLWHYMCLYCHFWSL